MITVALLDAAVRVLTGLFALIPGYEIDTDSFGTAGGELGSMFFGFDSYFPVTSTFAAVSLLLGLWVGLAAWNFAVWVFHQFWGSD